jgi:hypothetical protein
VGALSDEDDAFARLLDVEPARDLPLLVVVERRERRRCRRSRPRRLTLTRSRRHEHVCHQIVTSGRDLLRKVGLVLGRGRF